MRTVLKGGQVYDHGQLSPMDLLVCDGVIAECGPSIAPQEGDRVLVLQGAAVFPGFADVHVHLREPGFSYKETMATGTAACARGGYTTVCAMPNLNPTPDDDAHLKVQEEIIARDALIQVLPYGCITQGQKGEGTVVDMAALAPRVCGFSDDGRGVKTAETMREAMEKCKAAGSIIAAHCEDMSLIPPGGAIHEGPFAREHGIPGIPSSSEWKPIERDIGLVKETGCDYHVCHVSCRESVELIRRAKAEGINITCETGPHYLLLCQDDLQDLGRFKMNPPLRSKDDREALIEALLDGTIDMIATDHAPHSAEEKSRGLAKSAMGVVGIETAFPLLYTYLVEKGIVPLERIIEMLTEIPRRRFHLPEGGIQIGKPAMLTVFDLNARETIAPDKFLSMGKATPFEGWEVHAACRLTMLGDRIVYSEDPA